MFYVSGTKIYLATFDADMKIYPECKLVCFEDGTIGAVRTGSGVAHPPKHRRVCTLAELRAQLGHTAESATK